MIAIAAAAAACSRPSGTYLEISVPANAKAVELFIGDTPAGSATIGPPMSDGQSPKGRYYSGEGWTSVETSASFGALTGTSLTYRLEREPATGNTLQRLLVVAYDGQGDPVGVKILDDIPIASRATTLRVTLDPAMPIRSPNAQASAERVQVWRRPGDDTATRSACAMVWHPSDLAGSAVEFFVPDDDTDCDGASHECSSSSAWNYCEVDDTRLGILDASCMAARDNGACRVGGPPSCVDSGCDAPDCTPSPIYGCLPSAVCTNADTLGCSTLDASCVAMAIAPPAVPKVHCQLTLVSGQNCEDLLDATAFPQLGMRTCAGVQLQTFGPTPNFGSSLAADGVIYSLSPNGTGPCAYSLRMTGTPIAPPIPTPVFLVIDTTPAPDQMFYLPIDHGLPMTMTSCPPTPSPCTVDVTAPIPCP